jgi:phosphoglycolate phosphatase-like HAD superfamily hydrolase
MRFAVSNFSTLVFDCDGVILDSNRVKSDAFLTVAASFGAVPAQRLLEYHQRHGGVSRNEKFAYFLDELVEIPVQYRAATLQKLLVEFGRICARELKSCPLIPGVAALLGSIPASVASYVVTGGAQDEVRDVLSQRGLSGRFADILGSPTSKRDNMALLQDAGAFRGRSLFFGDAALDMRLAEEFGLDFVFVYGASEWSDGRAQCPYPQISDFTELNSLAGR